MSKKVLAIDDDRTATDLIAAALRPHGYQVTHAATAEEGVAAARDGMPDLIFLSLLLPGSNGLKVGKALHGMPGLERVPMVMLISYAGELDPKYMTTIGVVGVLVKPLNAADVIGAAQRILGSAQPAGVMEELPAVEEEEMEPSVSEGFGEDNNAETVGLSDRGDRVPEEREWEDMQEDAVPGAGEAKDFFAYELEEGEREREPSKDLSPYDAPASVAQYGGATEVVAEDEDESGPDRLKKVLMGVAAAVVIGGAVIGGLQAKKHFFPASKSPVQKAPDSAKPQQGPVEIKENMPEAGKREAAVPGKESAGAPADVAPKPAPAKPQTQAKKATAEKPGISVQVGVFVGERNAAELAEQLKKKGFDAFVLKDESVKMKGGKVAHRVLVGRFEDRRKAAVQATALEKEGIKSVIFSPSK